MVKKITHEQSRRNITRRGRRVAARHARAGRWAAQPRPMLGSGAVRYEVGANIDATGFGGIAAVHRLVTRLGLVERVDAHSRFSSSNLPKSSRRISGRVSLSGMSNSAAKVVASTSSSPWGQPLSVGLRRRWRS
ncbi:Hypothetical protein ERS031518_00984 [Mycobacterium tuberculosis]|uniref:Uncharacterized protein n=1 Tax=Mycobacterium tuberculosis TaxID=1773 RepID=A0A0U0QR31_MYCTX|nr:Hypothetical protein ERS024234_01164 [Mycobacterium tuberculosis]CKT37057.1 Hypothetical protein ERS031518_00984 [Mycobacterium tuberculosis]COV30490.1 Hypothetical protein ERS007703_01087 [Mycobacterium tuberculosis]COV40274.1 Hypothetical protein ERS007720_00136 [Mycobacterium tuberculosis]